MIRTQQVGLLEGWGASHGKGRRMAFPGRVLRTALGCSAWHGGKVSVGVYFPKEEERRAGDRECFPKEKGQERGKWWAYSSAEVMDSYLLLPAAMEKAEWLARSRDGSPIRLLGAMVRNKWTHRQMSYRLTFMFHWTDIRWYTGLCSLSNINEIPSIKMKLDFF